MAEDKKVTISRTLNGKIIYFIARNSTGKIIARELTQEKLEKAIKTYKEPPTVEEESQGEMVSVKDEEAEPKEKKFLIHERSSSTNKLLEKVQERKEEQVEQEATGTAAAEEPEEGEKKFLENELKTKVEERRQQSKKKSFWDKLK